MALLDKGGFPTQEDHSLSMKGLGGNELRQDLINLQGILVLKAQDGTWKFGPLHSHQRRRPKGRRGGIKMEGGVGPFECISQERVRGYPRRSPSCLNSND